MKKVIFHINKFGSIVEKVWMWMVDIKILITIMYLAILMLDLGMDTIETAS